MSPMQMIANFQSLISGGGFFIGGVLCILGIFTLAINLNGGIQGNGAAVGGGITLLVGGILFMVASGWFMSLDISWAGM